MKMELVRILLLAVLSSVTAGAIAQDLVLFNGGIGEDERATAPTEGTRLVFFDESGDYLANIKVSIKDMSGKVVLETVAKGPWLILKLPAGRYTLRAELNGSTQSGVINVDGSKQEFGYMFKPG